MTTLKCSYLALMLLWQLAADTLDVGPYIAKSPVNVWNYLFTDPKHGTVTAADKGARMLSLQVTPRDAAVGFGFGFGPGSSALLSIVFALVPALESMFLPLAMLMRTVPLAGFAPIIYLLLGNGTPPSG
ncbi:hypothetical protein ACIRVK_42145 [Streptomyces sp. NPDC101152]|uniref:hypothetical protein n=1 Tax=Streptomyces sp. NPDC101152 TaxID=3366116 RepID=UPI003822E4BB